MHEASGSGVRALVVRAEGPNFGTGGAVAEWPGKDVHWFHDFIDEVNQAYRAIEALRVPTIAAVRGKAIGGHFELVLHCDLIVAADNASFHAIESQTGMVPLAGSLQRLAERVGRGRTAELYLLSTPISGARATEIGLTICAVAEAEVDRMFNNPFVNPSQNNACLPAALKLHPPPAWMIARAGRARRPHRRGSSSQIKTAETKTPN